MPGAEQAVELKLVREIDGLEVDLRALQGLWTEEQYCRLTDQTSCLLEFTDGVIEVPALPTDKHQVILAFLYELLLNYIRPRGGKVLFAPLRLRIRAGKYREPDLLLVVDAGDPRRQNRYWLGADLVVEIVSPDDPERDTITKRTDYAEAAIPEYWIVDPEHETITVLALEGKGYVEHAVAGRGSHAASRLLAGLVANVAEVFDAE